MTTEDEIGSPNRLGRWLIIIAIVVGLPSLLFSSWTLDKLQEQVNKNYDKPWCADMQNRIAWAYSVTMRPDVAAERYEWAARLYENQRNFEAAGEALYNQGVELEAANKKYNALPVYEDVEDRYKEYPIGAKAHGAVVRLKTMSRP